MAPAMPRKRDTRDENEEAARVIRQSTEGGDRLPEAQESAWEAWARGIQAVDDRTRTLLMAAFEAGAASANAGRVKGAKAGGAARAAKLTAKRKRDIAQRAARLFGGCYRNAPRRSAARLRRGRPSSPTKNTGGPCQGPARHSPASGSKRRGTQGPAAPGSPRHGGDPTRWPLGLQPSIQLWIERRRPWWLSPPTTLVGIVRGGS